MFNSIIATDLSEKKTFIRAGYTYNQITFDPEHKIGIWSLSTSDGKPAGFEVVRGVKKKNSDGSITFTYPSSEQFGTSGWYYGTLEGALGKYNQLQLGYRHNSTVAIQTVIL